MKHRKTFHTCGLQTGSTRLSLQISLKCDYIKKSQLQGFSSRTLSLKPRIINDTPTNVQIFPSLSLTPRLVLTPRSFRPKPDYVRRSETQYLMWYFKKGGTPFSVHSQSVTRIRLIHTAPVKGSLHREESPPVNRYHPRLLVIVSCECRQPPPCTGRRYLFPLTCLVVSQKMPTYLSPINTVCL